MENEMQCAVSIPKKMKVLADITLVSQERGNKRKMNHSDITENDRQLMKNPSVKKKKTINESSKHGNSDNKENSGCVINIKIEEICTDVDSKKESFDIRQEIVTQEIQSEHDINSIKS